jgi:hypothetical protein
MAIDLKLKVADLNENSEETNDLLRAIEGVPWDLDLLRALTRAGFDAAGARGDDAIREEFHGAVINFWAKRADEVDAVEGVS